MWFFLAALVQADSGDTGPYEDTDAQAKLVYQQEEGGCGGKDAWVLIPFLGMLAAAVPSRRDG